MPTEYYLDDTISALVTELLDDANLVEFEPLRSNETKFLIAAVRKTNAEGETQPLSGLPVVIRKISSADAVFLPNFSFKLYVDVHRWDASNDLQRRSMLHKGLMRIKAELKENGVKYSTRRPDVETYQATVVRYGACEEPLLLLRENLLNAQKKAAQMGAKKPVHNV
jgi:hypothetical protein